MVRGDEDGDDRVVGTNAPLRKVVVECDVVPQQVILGVDGKRGGDAARTCAGCEVGKSNTKICPELRHSRGGVRKQFAVNEGVYHCVGATIIEGALTRDKTIVAAKLSTLHGIRFRRENAQNE